jgi:hypothetical protein
VTPPLDPLRDELTEFYKQVPPPPQGLAPGRQAFLAEAARVRDTAGQPATLSARLRQIWLQPVFRFASIALIAIFALSSLGGGLVHLAEASLPGDPLYPIKLAYEDLRLSLINDPTAGTEENLNYAAERVDEMRGLAERGSAIPDNVVDRMVEQMDQAVEQTAKASPEEASILMGQFRQRMRFQQEVLAQIQQAGPDGDQEPVQTALQVTERAYEIDDKAAGDPKRFQEEWLQQTQPEAPMQGDGETQYQHEHQNQNQSQPTEPAGPPDDDQVGPRPAPGSDRLPGASHGQSGKSSLPRPTLTPSPARNGW